MTGKKQRLALLTAIAFFLAMLFSAAYIVGTADHDCCGTDCPICAQISACKNILKNLSLAVGFIATVAALIYSLCGLPVHFGVKTKGSTPVSLRVKLLN